MTAPGIPEGDVERLFRRLVANLAALDPSRLSRPFPVADIAKSLVPYRTHRLALRFETSEDYEMAVLRLLAGEGGYAVVQPDEAFTAFRQEVAATNPDTALFREYGAATVHLDPEAVAHALSRPAGSAAAPAQAAPVAIREAAPAEAGTAGPDAEGAVHEHDDGIVPIFSRSEPAKPTDEALPFTLDDEEADEPAAPPRAPGPGCAYCGGELPVGRVVLFCPHCGQNVGVVHCPTCGSELDVGWQFCISCGQKVTGALE